MTIESNCLILLDSTIRYMPHKSLQHLDWN